MPPGNAAFDAARHALADAGRRGRRLGDDFLGRLDRRGIGIGDRRRATLGAPRRRRRRRRRWRRRRRRGRRERHHRGGVGSTSAAINGMMMTAAKSTTCARIDTGTVYHFLRPDLDRRIDDVAEHVTRHGSALPAALIAQCGVQRGARPRIIVRPKNQCQRTSHALIDTEFA